MRKVANILLVVYVVICGLIACFGHVLGYYGKNILIYFITMLIPGLSIYAVLYLIFGNKFEISKQFPFIKYHFKNTKNKIIFNIMICILIFICSFVYRPLELIIWNKLYFDDLDVKESKAITTKNPDEFLELYKQYGNSKPDSEDIMRFVDNFNTDFIVSSIFFFSESYLMAFMNKSKIYVNQYNNFVRYQTYHNISLFTPQNTNDYFTFIDKNMKITKMLDDLSDELDYLSFFSIMYAMIQMQFIFNIVDVQLVEQDKFCNLNTEYIMDAFMQNYNIIDKYSYIEINGLSAENGFNAARNALKEAIDECRK